jgi:hypothetical protein
VLLISWLAFKVWLSSKLGICLLSRVKGARCPAAPSSNEN